MSSKPNQSTTPPGTFAAESSSSSSKWFSGNFLPVNPFDLPETKDLVRQKIASGEITQRDVDIMDKGYKWMAYTPPAGALSFSALIWQLMKKQYPRPHIVTRLFWAGLSGFAGGLLGFGAAGVAAAMEVNDKIQDGDRKVAIFNSITEHARQIQEAKLNPVLEPAPIQVPASTTAMKQARSQSNLPRDFEFPPQREAAESLEYSKGSIRLAEEGKSIWGKMKGWAGYGRKD
ncbi:uncharacterized protein I206_104421 [Kwoniella pini CBS 10737]|uniref:Uncharacterized protein n=1 Tax=Kwoniella pini CBS 10737 TaxID=1296096 RepID=A0A1B9I1T1_9TREE|nr:uncharacterized protein I206_03998 [Kwoniella pini CBS 10737]OCF49477.1 hypothetical protein I206_03998 [Kwoniella pini CBS 10737]